MEMKYKQRVKITKGFYSGEFGHIIACDDKQLPGGQTIYRYTVEVEDEFEMRTVLRPDELEKQ